MRAPRSLVTSLLGLALLPACGGEPAPAAPPGAPTAVAGASRFALASEPGPATSVLAAKASGEAAEVVVTGRVKELVPGFAAFTLVDVSIPPCPDEEGCPTPWDFCCFSSDKVAAATLPVAARAKGEVVEASIPELRLLDLVVVRGALSKAADGVVRLEATGWFRRERPAYGAHVKFPR
jgi:hypothetical protein